MAAMPDDIDVAKITVIGLVTALLVVTFALMVQVLYYQKTDELHQAKDVVPTYRALQEYTLEQQEKLNRYGWVDRGNNTVTIPIGQAMALTLKDQQAARNNPQPPTSQQSPQQTQQPQQQKLQK